MSEQLNLLPWQQPYAQFSSCEEYIARAIDAANEALAVDGEFSIYYNVADDPLYRINIISIIRNINSKLHTKEETVTCLMFDRFHEIIPVHQVEDKIRQAINNLSVYIDAMYLLRCRLAYFDPSQPERVCYNPQCNKLFTGPAVYCCFNCAITDK
jgi:hypothetical protein